MLNDHLDQFLQHMQYERAVSPHTLRNYASDLEQFKQHLFKIEKRGDLPARFPAIRDELTARQAADGGAEADVDHLFDIPVVLVQAFTGFRHDEAGPDETSMFEVLESTRSAPAAKQSWFGRLLGR
jgi:hypothetical protein